MMRECGAWVREATHREHLIAIAELVETHKPSSGGVFVPDHPHAILAQHLFSVMVACCRMMRCTALQCRAKGHTLRAGLSRYTAKILCFFFGCFFPVFFSGVLFFRVFFFSFFFFFFVFGCVLFP